MVNDQSQMNLGSATLDSALASMSSLLDERVSEWGVRILDRENPNDMLNAQQAVYEVIEVPSDDELAGLAMNRQQNELEKSNARTEFPDELVKLAAQLEVEGYADNAICHACELTGEELVNLRQLTSVIEHRGDAKRELLERERRIDGSWDKVEDRALASLELELNDSNMLSVNEKLAIARTANAATRKRERGDPRLAGKPGEHDVVYNQHNIVQLNLPVTLIQQLQQAQRLTRDAFEERELRIANSIDPDSAHVDFQQAGEILGVDLEQGNSAGAMQPGQNERTLDKANTSIPQSVIISDEPG